MKTFYNQRFSDSMVVIDDSRFIQCSFHSCVVKYSGEPYEIIECTFSPDTSLKFEDAAMRTAALMQDLGILRDRNLPHTPETVAGKVN
jgi:hypothetical protein